MKRPARRAQNDKLLVALARGGDAPDIANDALTRALARLCLKYGSDSVAARARAMDVLVWAPDPKPRKQPGAKRKWGEVGNYHAWLAIELALQRARKTNPKATLADVLRRKFRRGGRWRVLHDATEAAQHLELRDARQARNRHAAGRRVVERNPALAEAVKLILATMHKN